MPLSWLFDYIQVNISKCSTEGEQGASTHQHWKEDRNNATGGKWEIKLEESCIKDENLRDKNH